MIDTRYFLKLSYNGTNYCGWQIQPNQKTVQGEINLVLTRLNKNKQILTMGCGRTDSGVHATQFYAHFDFLKIQDTSKFLYKLNTMLPHDIVIHDIIEVEPDAHSRYDAVSRTYQYRIITKKNAFQNDTALLLTSNLNIDKMNEASKLLLIYKDFEAFSKVKTAVNNFECTLSFANWEKNKNQIVFTITANRFLRNMVRAIVGTMLEIGVGNIELDEFRSIVESKNRSLAGKSVGATGLYLTEVTYPYLK